MAGFDPDQYLAEKTAQPFDPDAYLAEKTDEPARASDAEIEAARPKSAGEIALKGGGNFLSGGAKMFGDVGAGVAGLIGKLSDRIGLTKNAEKNVRTGHAITDALIDTIFGAGQPDQGYQLMQTAGKAAAGLALPAEKLVAPIAGLAEAARLPPALAQLAGRAAVNTGLGAAQGESVGHPLAGAVGGAVGTGLAEGAKSLGGQIIKSYIKGGHRGAAEGLDVPWFLNQEMGGTGPGMAQKVDARLSGLRSAQDNIIAQKGNLPTPVLQALQNVENKISTPEFTAGNLGSLPAAKSQLKEYLDDFVQIADPHTGDAPLHLAWEIKKKAGSDAAQLYRRVNSGNGSVRDMTKQGVSAMVATEMNDLIEKSAPEMTDLNPEFSKLIPVAKALERRNRIAGQHNPIGLDELAAIESGVNFMVHGHPGGMALPLAAKATKSPYFGQLLRDAANKSPRLTSLIPVGNDLTDLSAGMRGQQ
jgi:hypothetical protein